MNTGSIDKNVSGHGSPLVRTELPECSSDEATKKNLREFYRMVIPAEPIARAIAYAIEQPDNVEIDEVVVRPTTQDF
jgi:NADP-dependent 3-hydroxy acid dehydrogenase YdfG